MRRLDSKKLYFDIIFGSNTDLGLQSPLTRFTISYMEESNPKPV